MRLGSEMASSYEDEGTDESQHSVSSSVRSATNTSKSQKWTKEEDVSLKFLVEQHGKSSLCVFVCIVDDVEMAARIDVVLAACMMLCLIVSSFVLFF